MPPDGFGKEEMEKILERTNAALDREKQNLSQLDSHIGDGDHGFGMANGFRIGFEKVKGSNCSIEEALKTIGMSLIKEVGGASGTIFGSWFLGMARAVKGQETVGVAELADMLTGGLALVKERGKASPGDKTMVDALEPAAESLRQSANDGTALAEALRRAAAAAKQGAEKTKEMAGKKGRAKYFREKAIGYQDAGATTVSVILQAWAESLGAC